MQGLACNVANPQQVRQLADFAQQQLGTVDLWCAGGRRLLLAAAAAAGGSAARPAAAPGACLHSRTTPPDQRLPRPARQCACVAVAVAALRSSPL
jgi:hypothetical protein